MALAVTGLRPFTLYESNDNSFDDLCLAFNQFYGLKNTTIDLENVVILVQRLLNSQVNEIRSAAIVFKGLLLEEGVWDSQSTTPDLERAKECFFQASQLNSLLGYYYLRAYADLSQEKIIIDDKKIFDLIQLEARQKSPLMTLLLGECYYQGVGVDQDLKEAYNCFLEAHDLGVVQSTFLLGALYDRGEVPGYKRCIAKALLYYEMAAEKGHTDATYQAAYIYIQSHNLEIKNILKGVRWLHKAKDKGHMEALFLIGFYHEYGLIEDDKIYLERDQGKALSYYRLAAQKGHKEALRKLQDH